MKNMMIEETLKVRKEMKKTFEELFAGILDQIDEKIDKKFKEVQQDNCKENFAKWPFYFSLEELLESDKWVDSKGRIMAVQEMTLDYVANVLNFITRKQKSNNKFSGLEGDFWITETVLFRALVRRLDEAFDGRGLHPELHGPQTYQDIRDYWVPNDKDNDFKY